MRRPNRATVSDADLGRAFAEGVNEGLRLTGYVLIICKVGEIEKFSVTVKASQVPDVIGDFVAGLRGEDYEAGVCMRVMAQDSPPDEAADTTELGDGIEDAEVVDE